jgi:6-phosphogluconolactonase
MGLDRVMVYDLDQTTGRLTPSDHPFAQLASGSGPRHVWIHPGNRWVYVVNEVDSSISAFTFDEESSAMRIISTSSTRPEGFASHNTGAQIVVHPSGRFLYSSNRGHDSLACFVIDSETGRPRLTELVSTGGRTPRNFNIDPTGAFLVVANVGSNSVASFRIDPNSGRLSATGYSIGTPNPVCVMFYDGAHRSP